MRSKLMPAVLFAILALLIAIGLIYQQRQRNAALPDNVVVPVQTQATPSPIAAVSGLPQIPASPSPVPATSPAAGASLTPATTPVTQATNTNPDLMVDSNGLSKATVVITTNQGVIKFKLYPQDAPNTVKRIIQLINQGFYNGLTFHRVKPGFVIQGGDPQGNGTGGSGQKLKAEFNNRRHIEGTVAMARAADPDSADSQFYISLGTHPHLDHSYTIFGQVIEGMDVARKIKIGDKMVNVRIE